MANSSENGGGLEALLRLKSTDPPLFLSPSTDLSVASRLASQYLFSSLKPYTPKSPLDQLLTEGFDAEQIWQQIDLQSQPLISTIRREIKRFEKNPDQISKSFRMIEANGRLEGEIRGNGKVGLEQESDELEGLDDHTHDDDDEDDEEDDDLEGAPEEGEGRECGEEEEDDEEDDKGVESEDGGTGVEDEFLKIKELEKYLKEDEAREYGLENKKETSKDKASNVDGEEGDKDSAEEDERLALFGADDDYEEDNLENARYEDFFESKKTLRRKSKQGDDSDYSGGEDEREDDKAFGSQKKQVLSKHEEQLVKLRTEIEEMEKSNLDPKAWTMLGEVTASKRPKNSALEVDLDFEHNVRPPPVITEEHSLSLEELIKKRVTEMHFDNVQRAPKLPSKGPREVKELDDNKSKKGLAEIYEEEYAQKSGLISAPLSFSDELKKEASMLFKKLCLKLDALSHFHFAPKPVVEDMDVQVNVPALAMEEVAPIAVSDAAMLAPEEVFSGKGDIKEEAELTQEDRKQRRAKKKRKFKVEQAKRAAKKSRDTTLSDHNDGKELL
ncbi:hypothetical protein Nepgr_025253 [Nepenthes gracilis]|uniref:U3 small nucleolar ribonucleoprotein protein MPP10 n=1 Tax=Nepenthes gracilis TaxID=150966 RepID=A0AAD3T5H7_NEPGR|nr:hypothetical protein Nepgr_025253 [Nepenthes gracilis]